MLTFLTKNAFELLEISWFAILVITLVAITISFDRRPPAKTISWLLILVLLPVVGLILYLLFGENLRTKKWDARRQMIRDYRQSEASKDMFNPEDVDVRDYAMDNNIHFDVEGKNIMQMMLRTYEAPITTNNSVEIFTEGTEKFRRMMEDMEAATDHIHLEYFIVKDCPLAKELQALLIRKAEQGVEVRFLFDDMGSWKLYFHPSYMHRLRKAGVEAKTYVQARFPYLHRKLNYRNHRKICVIDGRIGYVGGLNIGPEYVHQSKRFGFWRDTHLRIEGPAVYFLQMCFLSDWLLLTTQKLLSRKYFPDYCQFKGSSMLQIAASGADTEHQVIYEAYFYAIAQARETVYIETPYFIPDEALLMAIRTATLSGVDVKIIFPSVMDHFSAYNASLSYLEQVLEFGAEVYLYDKQPGPSFIHSKMLLVDHEIASVGTANIDIRSFNINSEITAFIYDNKTILQLYSIFDTDLQDCRPLTLEDIHQKGFTQKTKEAFCRLLSPIL